MSPLVAIDVPLDTAPEYAAAVVGSCSAALGEGACQAAGGPGSLARGLLEPTPGSDPPTGGAPTTTDVQWVAVVRWDDVNYRTLRIELRPGVEQPPVETRVVAFTPADPPRQRWASAGLVVAALVSRRETGPRPPPVAPPAPAPPPPTEPSPPPEAMPPPAPALPVRSHPWARVDVGALAGPGLDRGPARLGGLLRVAVIPSSLPLALHVGTRLSARGGQPKVRWVAGSLGVTVRLSSWEAAWTAELRGEGVMEQVWMAAEDPSRQISEVARRWRFGGRLGGEFAYEFAPPAAIFAGLDVAVLRPEILVSINGEEAGNDDAVSGAGSAGFRLSF